MASYPSVVKTWVARRDLLDLVVAADVNTLYDEVTATQQELGTSPRVSPTWGGGTFTSSTTNWNSVKERLANIENGVYTSINERVDTSGGSTIVSGANSTVSLTIRAKSGQTANLLEVRNSSSTVVASVTPSGTLYAAVIDGGTA